MKIIEKDESLRKEEERKNATFIRMINDKDIQEYYVNGLVVPLIRQLRDLKWMYNDGEKIVSTSGEEIKSALIGNMKEYLILVNILSPIIDEETKKTL
jgi:hypothetical protein